MKKRPDNKRLNRPICRTCKNRVLILDIPYCKKIEIQLGKIGECLNYEKKIEKAKQICLEDLTSNKNRDIIKEPITTT